MSVRLSLGFRIFFWPLPLCHFDPHFGRVPHLTIRKPRHQCLCWLVFLFFHLFLIIIIFFLLSFPCRYIPRAPFVAFRHENERFLSLSMLFVTNTLEETLSDISGLKRSLSGRMDEHVEHA